LVLAARGGRTCRDESRTPAAAKNADAYPAEGIVQLIFYYVGFMALGDVADYLIGLLVERVWPQASLLTFLVLYFVFLWIAWLLAVKVTEPKASKQAAS
jgi:hypothetical protein